MYQQASFDDTNTLPLFSGTAQREPEQKAVQSKAPKQAGFFKCHVCRDTGTVVVDSKVKKCWCKE